MVVSIKNHYSCTKCTYTNTITSSVPTSLDTNEVSGATKQRNMLSLANVHCYSNNFFKYIFYSIMCTVHFPPRSIIRTG